MLQVHKLHRPGLPGISLVQSSETPQFLFIHGCTETSAIWTPVMEALGRKGIHSSAIDLRGHGSSEGSEKLQIYGIADYVDDVRWILQQIPSINVVVGHSMGGLITQLIASEVELSHAVLVASSPVRGMTEDGMRMARKHPWTFLASGFRKSFRRLYLDESVTRSLLFHADTSDETVKQFMASQQEDSWRAGNEMKTVLPNPTTVRCRITVIGGSEDFMVSRSSTDETAEAYRTKAIYIDKCAHMVPLEADSDELAEILMNCTQQTP